MTRNGHCSMCTNFKGKYQGNFQKLARGHGGLRLKMKRVYCCDHCYKVLETIWRSTFAIGHVNYKAFINLLEKKFQNRWIYADFVISKMNEKRQELKIEVS